jgi:hypothetical protein
MSQAESNYTIGIYEIIHIYIYIYIYIYSITTNYQLKSQPHLLK